MCDLNLQIQSQKTEIETLGKKRKRSSKPAAKLLKYDTFDDFDEQTNAVLDKIDDLLSDAPDGDDQEVDEDYESEEDYNF